MNGFPLRLILNTSWTPWCMVEHSTNEKYTQIMASSFKISKRYLSDFLRFIIIESLQDMKFDQMSPFLMEKIISMGVDMYIYVMMCGPIYIYMGMYVSLCSVFVL